MLKLIKIALLQYNTLENIMAKYWRWSMVIHFTVTIETKAQIFGLAPGNSVGLDM